MEMAHMGSVPCQFDKWNCHVFIKINKYKIVFKIKDYLRIILLMTIKDLRFKQVHKYARLRKQKLVDFRVHVKQFCYY